MTALSWPLALAAGAALTVAGLLAGIAHLFRGRPAASQARVPAPAGPPPAAMITGPAPVLWRVVAGPRLRREVEQGLEDVLSEVGEHLRAGESLVQALRHAAEGTVRPPWPELLRQVMERYERGTPLPEALSSLTGLGGPAVNLAVQAMCFHYRSGGGLGEVLLRLADDAREARLFQNEVGARTAEARWTAFTLAVLPVLLVMYFGFAAPGLVAPLLVEPAGRVGAAYAAFSWLSGLWLVRRLVRSL